MKLETAKKRFFSKIEKTPTGCWEWQGCRTPQGYGKFVFNGEQLAHRVSFIIHRGPLFGEMCVLHRCDNPPCVNPDHLFLGTKDMNNKDRAAKGRTVHRNTGKTHCKHGHEFDQKNTYYRKNGSRFCRRCAVIHQTKRKANASV